MDKNDDDSVVLRYKALEEWHRKVLVYLHHTCNPVP